MKKLRPYYAWYTVVCLIFYSIFSAQAETVHPKDSAKERVFTYIDENKESLLGAMEEIESWSEEYYILFIDGGQIEGGVIDWPHNRRYVADDSICGFFNENLLLHSISFPVNSDIVVFETEGLGLVTSSVEMGFYYSPQDKPAWINSEQLKPFGLKTGQYLDYPMLQEGNGWIPDTSVLDPENDTLLKSYGLYTERICENFFYFESWY